MRPLKRDDPFFAAMCAALDKEGLPTDDLFDGDAQYFAWSKCGFGGLVRLSNDTALLRSIVVAPERRGTGFGVLILEALLSEARSLGLREVWLLTQTADGFFRRHGFVPVPRTEAPDAIKRTAQFAQLCPETAILMVHRPQS